jgi:hypothetical protein
MTRGQIGVAPVALTDALRYGDLAAKGLYQPSDYGAMGWTVDPIAATTSALFTTGRFYYFRAKITSTGVITNINVSCSVLGSGLTSINFGIYTLAGAQLGVSADVKASFTATGNKIVPLVSPTISVTAGTEVLVAYLGVGTTLPSLQCTQSVSGNNILLTTASPFRAGQGTATSQTALPSNFTMSAFTAGSNSVLAVLN